MPFVFDLIDLEQYYIILPALFTCLTDILLLHYKKRIPFRLVNSSLIDSSRSITKFSCCRCRSEVAYTALCDLRDQ